MKMLQIPQSTTLAELTNQVGTRNVSAVLAANRLTRSPDIGAQQRRLQNEIYAQDTVAKQRKSTILNSFANDSDIFEAAALQDENGWKMLNTLGALPNTLRIPEGVAVPNSVQVMGDGKSVPPRIYLQALEQIKSYGSVSPAIFASYSSLAESKKGSYGTVPSAGSSIFELFHIPWGKVTLYSSLAGTSINFPVFPEELDDGVVANFTTMPDLLYQYEPWQLYQSSGPRSNNYTFHFHRDMWTGNHLDGKANELIRFCEANCYPEFNGSAVNVSTVTLYIAGQPLITGVMNKVDKHWSGPIGHDDWYLECKLEISITEVSPQPLNFGAVMSKGLIG